MQRGQRMLGLGQTIQPLPPSYGSVPRLLSVLGEGLIPLSGTPRDDENRSVYSLSKIFKSAYCGGPNDHVSSSNKEFAYPANELMLWFSVCNFPTVQCVVRGHELMCDNKRSVSRFQRAMWSGRCYCGLSCFSTPQPMRQHVELMCIQIKCSVSHCRREGHVE